MTLGYLGYCGVTLGLVTVERVTFWRGSCVGGAGGLVYQLRSVVSGWRPSLWFFGVLATVGYHSKTIPFKTFLAF